MGKPASTPASFVPRLPLLAAVAALGLALSASRGRVDAATALVDALLAAALLALVWGAARARHGERGGSAAAVALVLFAPLLGAVGGGGLAAPLLLTAGLVGLARCLLDPTVLRIAAAGGCAGLAVALLEVDGAGRATALAWLAAGAAALAWWRVRTAERCEPRGRVARGAAASVVLATLVGAAVLAMVDALPPLEATEYARVTPAAAPAPPPALDTGAGQGALLAVNGLSLLVLVAARRWRPTGRYADGATVIGLAVAAGIGTAVAPLLALLVAPWLALLAGAALGEGGRAGLMRLAAAALVVQALSAVLLWPDYPRLGDRWSPLPVRAEGVPT